jgi:hypothetical protein
VDCLSKRGEQIVGDHISIPLLGRNVDLGCIKRYDSAWEDGLIRRCLQSGCRPFNQLLENAFDYSADIVSILHKLTIAIQLALDFSAQTQRCPRHSKSDKKLVISYQILLPKTYRGASGRGA